MKSSLFRTNVSAHWKYVEQNHKDAANTTFILQGINEVVQRLNTVVSDSFWPLELQPARLLCSPLSPGVCSNSCPLSQWCHPTISSSVVPFSSSPQSFPASGSFPMSRPFASGGQSIRASASVSVLPMNIQDWFPLGWTGLISLLSKGLSRGFFSTQPSLWSSSHIHIWLLEKS